ncbi:MAG: hypothetical protein K9G13_00740 [Aquiluna sp.]|nr:hypothetical protein [Aquiluna sp.]MCF8545061.1 hypothetical protein [Aquiluna sp.]
MANTNTDPGHGNSVASWTTVTIVMIAFTLGTLFYWLDNAPLVWASAVLAALGPLVGFFLKRAGYGVGGAHTKNH